MRWKNILVAAVVLVVLIVFVALSGKERQEEEKPKLMGIAKESVTRFELKWGQEHAMCSKSQDGTWRMEQPMKARAGEREIDGILREMEDAQIDQEIDLSKEGMKLEEYGLDTPQLEVSLETQDTTLSLKLGDKDAEGSKIYVTREEKGKEKSKAPGQEGQQVLLVNASLLASLQKTAFDLRDKALVHFDKAGVDKLQITCSSGEYLCEKRDDNEWYVVKPMDTRADKDEVESLINELDAIRARKFLVEMPEDTSPFGPVECTASVWVKGSDAPQTITLGRASEKDPGVSHAYAQGGEWVCLVDSAAKENLTVNFFDLRDKVLSSFKTADVRKMEIFRDGELISAERRKWDTEEGWQLLTPVEWKADSDAVEDVLLELEDLRALQFVEDAPTNLALYGLDPPMVTMTITLARKGAESSPPSGTGTETAQEEKVVILLGSLKVDEQDAQKRTVYAMRQGVPTVTLVDDDILVETQKPDAKFQDKTILAFDSWNARGLTLATPDATLRLARPEGGLWKMSEPLSGECEDSSVNDILYAMDDLKADEFVTRTPADLSAYGLDAPSITVTVSVKADKNSDVLTDYTLLVGSIKKGIPTSPPPPGQQAKEEELGVYVTVQGGGWVCLAPATLVDDLTVRASDLVGSGGKTSP